MFYDRALLVIVIIVSSSPERQGNLTHFLPHFVSDVSDTFESVSDLWQCGGGGGIAAAAVEMRRWRWNFGGIAAAVEIAAVAV